MTSASDIPRPCQTAGLSKSHPPGSSTPHKCLLSAAAALPLFFASCSSTSTIEGVPKNLPEIALAGSTDTPPHNMASYEYPFDSSGGYVSDWAAEGERRAGRSARATSDDEVKWSSSHGGRASAASSKKKATTAKSKSKSKSKSKPQSESQSVASKSKKPAPDDEARPAKSKAARPKSETSTTASKPKSKGAHKYVVKKGDTVERIASRNGTTRSKLMSANGLKSDVIRIGQTLTIPD